MIATSKFIKTWQTNAVSVYVTSVMLLLCYQSACGQEFNLTPSWIVIETEEVVPYPELLPVNDEMIKTLVSSIGLYKSSFTENYDSTLFFVMSLDMIQDSAVLSISKQSFSWYSIHLRQNYESVEDRPLGSFELAGILFIVENGAEEFINRFFKVKTGVNRISVKSRKLLEPGVYNERQTFRVKYEVSQDFLKLIHSEIEAYKFMDIYKNKY